MAAIYVKMIHAGKMTLEQVPDLWREEVKALLEKEEIDDAG